MAHAQVKKQRTNGDSKTNTCAWYFCGTLIILASQGDVWDLTGNKSVRIKPRQNLIS